MNIMRKIKIFSNTSHLIRVTISTRFPWKKSALYLPDKKAEFVII